MLYLLRENAAYKNLELISNGAYTSQEAYNTYNHLKNYHYDAKRFCCLALFISNFALAILLGNFASANAYTLILLNIAPLVIWHQFFIHHAKLKQAYEIESFHVQNMIFLITNELSQQRTNKRNSLLTSGKSNIEDLELEEKKLNREGYPQLVELTRKAKETIKKYYEWEIYPGSRHPINDFVKICADYCGTAENSNKEVIRIENGRPTLSMVNSNSSTSLLRDEMIKDAPNGALLNVKIIPNADRNQIIGKHEEKLKIKLQVPTAKSDQELRTFLSRQLDIPESSIILVKGGTSLTKSLQFTGYSKNDLQGRLRFS